MYAIIGRRDEAITFLNQYIYHVHLCFYLSTPPYRLICDHLTIPHHAPYHMVYCYDIDNSAMDPHLYEIPSVEFDFTVQVFKGIIPLPVMYNR